MTYTLIPFTKTCIKRHSPSESELNLLANIGITLRTNENRGEKHQKIALIEFLAKSFAYECNTKNRIEFKHL